MSTSVWPPLPPEEVKAEEEASLANELHWLLLSLQSTLSALKSGLEECYALLAPIEPGSTLVISSARSESVKGVLTRVGSRITKGTLQLKLKTLPVMVIGIGGPGKENIVMPELTQLRTLLNQSLDCIDITRWTGDRDSASFISSQLRLLHSILLEALQVLKGPSLLKPKLPSSPSTTQGPAWTHSPPNPESFTPPLPAGLSLDLGLSDACLVLTIRTLENANATPNAVERFAFAIGAQRRLEHDEMDDTFFYRGEEVRVREKVRVVGGADPSLLSLGAKLGMLEGMVGMSRQALGVVSGLGMEGDEE